MKDANARAQQVEKDIKANAEVDIQKMRAAANVEIQAERERALKEMRSEIAALAIAAAQKLVGEALDEKRQHRLLEEFFSGIKDGRVIVLEGETISGESAEVTSAVELSGEERQTVEKELKSHLNKDAGDRLQGGPADHGRDGHQGRRPGDGRLGAGTAAGIEH